MQHQFEVLCLTRLQSKVDRLLIVGIAGIQTTGTANKSSDTDPPGVATSPILTAWGTGQTDRPVSIPHLQGKPRAMPGGIGVGGDADAAPSALCRHLPNFCTPGQRKNHVTLFSLLRKGSESPKDVRLHKGLNFIFPWGSSAPSPSPPPRQALTSY